MSMCQNSTDPPSVGAVVRLRAEVRGMVQGVGFRPFVYRLATALGLKGWVCNAAQGVVLEVEGSPAKLAVFLERLWQEKPAPCIIQSLEPSYSGPAGYTAFEVRQSEAGGQKSACILPDLATCVDCLRELFDPADRRHRYPFINCTNCGPRFSILEALPYDRERTTMKRFPLCDRCRAEYHDPTNRRFHAEPNACPTCGPRLDLWDTSGKTLATHDDALRATATALRGGEMVAVKGLGGFHLFADARNNEVVSNLRRRKAREEKPFAVMFPSLAALQASCDVSVGEERLLCSPEAPIVLLRRKEPGPEMAPAIAPGNPYFGAMLPYTPLHHLLLSELGVPVVATSGNRSDEPICTDEREALQRLGGIADRFLVHNRPIVRPVDDSVVCAVLGREMVLRRARGYAPAPLSVREPLPPLLAVGAHLKNTVAVAVGRQVFLSQHLGDLETAPAFEAFRAAAADLPRLYDCRPAAVACDAHPDYLSSQFAEQTGLPVVRVQHHHAHVLACMAEHDLAGAVLGVAWDGTGHGDDGTAWGGEFLRVTDARFERLAHFRPFRLPGGDRAAREPRRSALGLLYELLGDAAFTRLDLAPLRAFTAAERGVLRTVLERRLNAPLTSAAGRLFDAVAALVGLRQVARFEGQAAMELEFAIDDSTAEAYDPLRSDAGILDWELLTLEILRDLEHHVPTGVIAAKFHNSLAEVIVAVARQSGMERVVLTGGCFQNRRLLERAVTRLEAAGFRPYWHCRLPPNDGGIAVGQIMAAARARRME
jgi:hydrogenase maturation protein HypF